MFNRVFKNGQISYGVPFQVKIPITDETNAVDDMENNPDENFMADNMDDFGIEADEPIETEPVEKTPEQILEIAQTEADSLLSEAETEASKIIEAARSEAAVRAVQIEEEAWQKGYAEGIEAAAKQYEETLEEADGIRREAATEHDKLLADMEDEIISMVISVSRKVVARELELDKESILSLVKQAIDQCSNKSSISVKVSPDDYECLMEKKDKLLATLEGVGDIEIRQELSLKAGACIIETPFGNMDAGVNTKLRMIEEAFNEILEGK